MIPPRDKFLPTRDRIEFVVVATGTVRGCADEGRHRLSDHVVSVEVIECHGRGAGTAEFQRTCGNEPERSDEMALLRIEMIGRKLLANESWP